MVLVILIFVFIYQYGWYLQVVLLVSYWDCWFYLNFALNIQAFEMLL